MLDRLGKNMIGGVKKQAFLASPYANCIPSCIPSIVDQLYDNTKLYYANWTRESFTVAPFCSWSKKTKQEQKNLRAADGGHCTGEAAVLASTAALLPGVSLVHARFLTDCIACVWCLFFFVV
jgi:hypothetical protein